jgi:type I restriction enzyme S subunit
MTEIGEIPQEWGFVKLGDVLSLIKNGVTYKQNKKDSGYPVTRIETISEEKIDTAKVGYIDNIKTENINDYRLIEGDILFSHINSLEHIGKTAIYEGEPELLLHGMNLLLLRSDKSKIEPSYLVYSLKFYRAKELFKSMAKRAVNQASINQTELKRIKIPLPPLPEQQKIAEILSTADDEIQKMDEQIALAEQLKKGLMQKLLTRGIGHTRFKMTEIGGIPEEWDVRELKEFAKVEYGKSNPRTDGKIPLVGSSGVFGRVAKALIESPTIVIGRKGTAGAVWDIESPSWPSDTSFYLIYKNYGIVQKYLYSFMSLNKLSGDKAKTTLPSLQKTELEKFIVPLPPFPEQQKIAEILSTVDNKLELLRRKKEKLDVLKKGLMNDLLTGKVRVKV